MFARDGAEWGPEGRKRVVFDENLRPAQPSPEQEQRPARDEDRRPREREPRLGDRHVRRDGGESEDVERGEDGVARDPERAVAPSPSLSPRLLRTNSVDETTTSVSMSVKIT